MLSGDDPLSDCPITAAGLQLVQSQYTEHSARRSAPVAGARPAPVVPIPHGLPGPSTRVLAALRAWVVRLAVQSGHGARCDICRTCVIPRTSVNRGTTHAAASLIPTDSQRVRPLGQSLGLTSLSPCAVHHGVGVREVGGVEERLPAIRAKLRWDAGCVRRSTPTPGHAGACPASPRPCGAERPSERWRLCWP